MSTNFLKTNIVDVEALKIRDISYFQFGNNAIGVSCDSSGSIGSRKEDKFRETPYRSGIVLIEVPLKEVLSCGMEPIAIYVDLCYQDDDYNREFKKGIEDVIESVGYSKDILFVTYGKYDKEPLCSSYGITIISRIQKSKFRLGKSQSGDLVYSVALPQDKDYFDKHLRVGTLKKLLDYPYVHEILPGGSHGIFYEANELAKTIGLDFIEGDNELLNNNRTHSCGAACCCLVTIDPKFQKEFESIQIPNCINLYGKLQGTKLEDNLYDFGSNSEYELLEDGSIVFSDGYVINSDYSVSFCIGKEEKDETIIDNIEDYGIKLVFDTIDKLNDDLLIIINNLGFAMDDGGKGIIVNTRKLLEEKYKGIDLDAQFTGSTEDNWPVVQTGFAVRVLGIKRK